MKTSHTPGPWVADNNSGFSVWTVWSGNAPSGASPSGKIIASVVGDSPEADANAELIAAAPELLEACKLAEEFIALDCDCNENDDDGNPLKELRAAIAKATGGQS